MLYIEGRYQTGDSYSIEWHMEDSPGRVVVLARGAYLIEATGAELDLVLQYVKGIPVIPVIEVPNKRLDACKWFGDDARFIIGNLATILASVPWKPVDSKSAKS